MPERSIHTLAVHAGERAAKPAFTPVVTPIYHASSYVYDEMETLDATFAGTFDGPMYTRYGNPTVSALEAAVAALEGGEAALAYGSGMAAIHGALLAAGARAGTTVVAGYDVYGATYALLSRLLASQGVTTCFVDAADLDAVGATLAAARSSSARPVALIVETISNPLLKVADLPALAEVTHAANAALIVDNTFASPYLCRPLGLGADYVVHSATKYLGGHGDVLAGVVVTSQERRRELNEINKLVGANLGPQEAWLVLRGVKTLPLRVQRQCENAVQVAAWLAVHPQVSQVNYPGLASHPQHALAGAAAGTGRVRRDDQLRHPGWRPGTRLPLHGGAAAGAARDDAGRRLQPGAVPRPLLAPCAGAGVAAAHRHRRRAGAAVGGHRGSGGHHRGSGAGVGALNTLTSCGLGSKMFYKTSHNTSNCDAIRPRRS